MLHKTNHFSESRERTPNLVYCVHSVLPKNKSQEVAIGSSLGNDVDCDVTTPHLNEQCCWISEKLLELAYPGKKEELMGNMKAASARDWGRGGDWR